MMQTMEKLKEIPGNRGVPLHHWKFQHSGKTLLPGQRTPDETIFDGILRIQGISTTRPSFRLTRLSNARVLISSGLRSVEKRTGIGNDGTKKLRVRPAFYGSGSCILANPENCDYLAEAMENEKNRRSFVLPRSLHSRRLMRWRVTTAFAARFTATPIACS